MNDEKELSSKELIRFITLITQLEPTYFMGIARLMNVHVYEDENTKRAYEEILSDMIDTYISFNRTQRKNLMKIIKKVK